MYTDKDKQREANREAAQRRRDKAKGMTPGYDESMTESEGMTQEVIPEVPVTPTGLKGRGWPAQPITLYYSDRKVIAAEYHRTHPQAKDIDLSQLKI